MRIKPNCAQPQQFPHWDRDPIGTHQIPVYVVMVRGQRNTKRHANLFRL